MNPGDINAVMAERHAARDLDQHVWTQALVGALTSGLAAGRSVEECADAADLALAEFRKRWPA